MLLLSKKNHMGTRGVSAPAWGLSTPPVHTWRLGLPQGWAHPNAHVALRIASGLCTSQCTRGVWAPASVVGTPCAHMVLHYCLSAGHASCAHMMLGLLPQY